MSLFAQEFPPPAPRLVTDTPAALRAPGEVQLGLDSDRGVVLAGLSPAESDWLLSLHRRSLPSPPGSPALDRTDELAALLQAHDLVRGLDLVRGDAQPPTSPTRQLGSAPSVALLGRGRLAGILRAQMHRSGIRVVSADQSGSVEPDVTVLLASPAISMHDAQEWAGSGNAHLPVVVRSGYACIGPLIVSGIGPCLHCLDLARTDRDPAWPRVLGSMAARTLGTGPAIHSPAAVSSAVAGLTTMVLRAHGEGLQVPVGVAWDLRPPSPTVTARRWERHPLCTIEH